MGFLGLFTSKISILESGILQGAVDRHSHILYGVDDGISIPEDSLEVLKFQESLGVKEVWCTPHIMEDVPNTTEFLKARFDELKSIYKGPIKLNLAAEYMIDTVFEARLEAGDLLTMEDDTLLMETSTIAPPYDLKGSLRDAMSKGYRPLFAHPERCRFLGVQDCEELVEMGVGFQLNIASLTGYYGQSCRSKAEEILKKGLYSTYGSDCHRVRAIKEQYSRKELPKAILQLLHKII
jgi:tyrosine-protein phosphatase YwqE